jgi:predicted dehydrogenase
MREIGVGIIGWGFMGRTHAHALREMPLFYPGCGFRPVIRSVCTRRIDAAREAAQALGAAHFADDYWELIAREDIDVLSVSTPNALHEGMILDALRAGKHLYIDKPLTVDGASAARIEAAARASGSITQMAFNNRFFPSVLRAKQLIDEGRIGNLLTFSARYDHSGSIDPNRPAGWKMLDSAGVLLDLGSHALDMLAHLIGYPERVLCRLRTLYPERPAPGGGTAENVADDQAVMLLEMPGGAVGTATASKITTGAEDELSFEIYGDRGAVRWRLMEADYLEFYDNTRPEAALGGERGFTRIAATARFPAPGGAFLPPKNRVGWDRAHMHCYYRFLDCVNRGVPADPDLFEGAKLQYLMDAMVRSHERGAWVRFPD